MMLQSFILIHDRKENAPRDPSIPNLSVQPEDASDGDMDISRNELLPEFMLREMGLRVYVTDSPSELGITIGRADAVLLSVAPDEVEVWRRRILAARSLPVLWWCDQNTFPSHQCKVNPGIDGMLGPGMSQLEIHCALLLSVNHYFQRTEWQQEREQLLSKLEERKWIDQAKRILSEMKNISEAEAYEVLRKQAMNDRKRLADVATSIVKVYQLLQEEHKGGRKR